MGVHRIRGMNCESDFVESKKLCLLMSEPMRNTLDHLPAIKRVELERVVKILHEEFEEALVLSSKDWKKKGRIQRIILFGSYAKGKWVDEPHTKKGYLSDYDILVIVNYHQLTDMSEIWHNAEDRLLRHDGIRPVVNFIVHTMKDVNHELRAGQYFFSDIVREGIVLYELAGTSQFATPIPLTPEDALRIAEKHYETWMFNATEFVPGIELYIERNSVNKAVFLLHQYVECLYTTLLLTLTNYNPHSHNIKFLRSQCERIDERLIDVWPNERPWKRHFELLKRAYIEARYSPHYEIKPEELKWLSERAKVLESLIGEICGERLAELKRNIS